MPAIRPRGKKMRNGSSLHIAASEGRLGLVMLPGHMPVRCVSSSDGALTQVKALGFHERKQSGSSVPSLKFSETRISDLHTNISLEALHPPPHEAPVECGSPAPAGRPYRFGWRVASHAEENLAERQSMCRTGAVG